MSTQPVYPAARAAAARIQPRFAQRFTPAGLAKDTVASLPDAATVAFMIDAAFWASLRREEGYTPLISLAFVSPEQAMNPLRFARSLPLGSKALTKLAPAVERPGIHLGVWPEGDELRVWGATRHLPPLCFVLEVFAPGLLAVKRSRSQESGKYVNIAVIQGDEVKILDERAATEPDCPGLLTSLLGLESQFATNGNVSVLIQLAVSVREHRRGGTLLVIPGNSDSWQKSILHPITYSVAPTFSILADLMRINPEERPDRTWQDVVTKEVDGIAGLTAVDGATLITDSYDLLAFGAKIIRRSGWAQVSQVILTEPVEDATPIIADPAQIGGTRHLSAAQFVHDQRDAMAMVASQDGRFTVFAWSTCEEMVHAHRIDALLM
jgi:hypothetical protein